MTKITKKQKKWLWIFIAMFAVPEIIWGPIMNYLYIFYKGGNNPVILRDNFLMQSDYRGLLVLAVFTQMTGALFASILFVQSKISIVKKIILSVIFSLLFILALYIFVLLAMPANINIG